MKKRWIVLLIIVILISGVRVAPRIFTRQELSRGTIYKKKIACVGDSITYGAGVRPYQKTRSYPAYLQHRAGKGYVVQNYGKSRRTLLDFGNYPYVKEECYRKSLEAKADIYIIMLGTNDSKAINWNAAQYEIQLKRFIKTYQRENPKAEIYIMQPPKCFIEEKESPGRIRNHIIKNEIHEIVGRVGYELHISVIDLYHYTEEHEEWFTDGVHPNALGNKEIADYIYENIFESNEK